MLTQDDRDNFNDICDAAKADRLVLMECADKETGKPVAVICAVNFNGENELELVPFAHLFTEDPYKRLTPPENYVHADGSSYEKNFVVS